MQIQRQGSFKDEGYRLLGNRINLITEASALEAMIKFYTQDIARYKGLGRPTPAVLKANLYASKKRAEELGHNPQDLLERHNPAMESGSDFHRMAREVYAGLQQTNRERARLEGTYKLDVQG